ncbi:MFS transporter [Priestia megaterium]|uniref:MFS transporter n=1 Tax=Priestia megaterium TaxID=1404 RepID=A0A6M6E2K2_PRIMG|nr:MFS transporter [Priestia megaterium]MDH3155989.1 MFS transporter [Priestia megaterium]MED4116811.1 MFS transporter [Priestia megaterium]QJX81182.1 MFS transporter [Priestia megaterium]
MNKIITLFFFVMFVIGTDTFLISPLLPTLSDLYNVSTDISGWMVSAYALGYAVFAFIAGPISDNLNRKKVMLYGMIAFTISTFLCGVASSFWMMCAMRLIAGISAAFVTPQVWASIPLLVKPEKIVKSMGIATAGLAISQAFGLPIGSYFASFSWNTPFFVLSGCSFVLILLIAVVMPSIENKQNIQNKQSILGRYRSLFLNPKASTLFLAYLLFQTGNFASFNFLGTWLSADYNFNVTQIGLAMLILGIGNFCGSFFGSGYVSKIGNASTLFGGLILMAALYFSLPFYHNIALVEVAFFLMFFIAGILFPLMMSLLQSLSANARGTIAALSNSAMYIGTTLGTCIAGFLYHYFGNFISVTTFTASMFIISILIYKVSGVLNPVKANVTKEQNAVK